MTYPSFKDKAAGRQFEEEGYTVIYSDQIAGLRAIEAYINTLNLLETDGLYYSLLSNDYDQNKQISRVVRENLRTLYDKIFGHYTVRNESFLMKLPGDTKELFLHQDWFFTDVERFQSATLWAPLCDVDETNGSLFLIPKSHRFFKNYISGSLPTTRISIREIPQGACAAVNMKFGDVLLFNPAVFHGSNPNLTPKKRIIVTANIFPENAPYCYYHKIADNKAARIEIDDEAVLQNLQGFVDGRIEMKPPHRVLDYVHFMPGKNEILEKIKTNT